MTATPVPGVVHAQVATSGSTTRRAGLWQSPAVRRGVVDLAAVSVLLSTGVLAFGPVFGGAVGYVAAAGGVVLGLILAVVSAWRGWTKLGTLLAGILVYLALGGALALPDTTVGGLVPTLETVERLTLLSWQSWRDVLTVPLPAGDFDGPVVLPYLVALASATLAAGAVLRLRRRGWVVALTLLPAATFLVVGILWGSHEAPVAALQGALFVVAALGWTSWRSHLGSVDTHVVFLRSATTSRGPRTRQAVTAGAFLALAAALGIGGWLMLAPEPDRHVLRDQIDPPFDPDAYPSPLTKYRYLESDLEEEVLFTVTGLPDGSRIRLAAMDVYDGNVYNVTESSAEFARVGSSVKPSEYSDPQADLTELSFHIEAYAGVWLPGGGDLRRLDADDLGDVYYNAATGTALTTSGLAEGSNYTVEVALAPSYTAEQRADLPSDAKPDQSFPIAPNTATVDAVGAVLPELQGEAATPMDQLRAIETALRTDGFYADGDPDPSLPGHTSRRIEQLLADENGGPMVGDDEQYAVAAALMARDLGLPARVVMGFYPDPDATATGDEVAITGDDAHVWIEVKFEDLGWVPFDPTPEDDQRLDQQQPEPQKRRDPQVLPPPDIPEDRDPKAPPPADSDVDKDEESGGGIWRILRIAAITVGAAVALVGPFALIAALKARRRRRRRTTGRLSDRISGGWAEIVDLATDVGVRVPPPATRFESAVLLHDLVPPATSIPIALRVDAHVFGAAEPTDVDVETVWTAVDALRTEFRKTASVRRRIRQRFSVRSLLKRPRWLSRDELSAMSGGSR